MVEFDYNPVQIYGKHQTTPTEVTDGDTVILATDTMGKLLNSPNLSSNALFTGSVFTTASTYVVSTSIDTSSHKTKTLATYLGGSTGTLYIQTNPTNSGTTMYTYSSSNLPSGEMIFTTLTDSFGSLQTLVAVATVAGTVTQYLNLQD